MQVLTVNVGSSSVKLRVIAADEQVVGSADPTLDADLGATVTDLTRSVGAVGAIAHRIVHGGALFDAPVLLDGAVRRRLADLADLAPLHQPVALRVVDELSAALLSVPAVACFDTAFHSTLPPAASTYAIPEQWRQQYGVRRYGFHGISHAYVARRTAEMLGRPSGSLRVISCHLGAGCSLAAVHGGRCVDTTMGFTPLEGVVMATRSGSVDPGALLWLQQHAGLSAQAVADGLEHQSGLVGLAGEADMRKVLLTAAQGDLDASLAVDVYVHRLAAHVGAMAAALDGLDALVFTGGVGEHATEVRRRVCERLGFLGVALDPGRNAELTADGDASADTSNVRTLVVTAREDLELARGAQHALSR